MGRRSVGERTTGSQVGGRPDHASQHSVQLAGSGSGRYFAELATLAWDVVRLRLYRAGERDRAGTDVVCDGPVPSEVPPSAVGFRIEEPSFTLRLSAAAPSLVLERHGGERVLEAAPDGWIRTSRKGIQMRFLLAEGTRFYGFGQKLGPLDRSGRRLTMWNTDDRPHLPDSDPLYQSIPFGIAMDHERALGIFLDHPGRAIFDLGATEPRRWSIDVEGHALDVYLFVGPEPKRILDRYTELTGRPFLPPKWALGYHQSRWGYASADHVREIAAGFRARAIPCDAIYLDIDHMQDRRVFTWDRERFPDPRALATELREHGFRLVPIVDPGVKADPANEMYREGVAQGHFCRTVHGDVYIGKAWPGRAAFPDFERKATRAWWGNALVRALVEQGAGGIWNDMNEPSNFTDGGTLPAGVLQRGPDGERSHREIHNLYGLRMCQATYDALRRAAPDEEPFVLTRAGYAGIQRYAAVWMGDNASWWEHLLASIPLCLGMGLSGVPFVGSDVGGFDGDCTGELLVRWMQVGAFLPLFRNHCSLERRAQEPWAFGPEIEALCRAAIERRYRLLPYLYELFVDANRVGTPIVRPLWLEFPKDEESYQINDEFMLGPNMLIAPVYVAGVRKRAVYLPAGRWVGLDDRELHEGPGWILADAPIEKIPAFVRAGSRLPVLRVAKQNASWRDDEVELVQY